MPWFSHPIDYRIRQYAATGPWRVSLRATIPFLLERFPGDWVLVPDALVDSGASLSIFSAEWARRNGFVLPPRPTFLPIVTATGLTRTRVYDLDLNARFPQLPECTFSLAVVFSEAHPPTVPPLLGLHNLLNTWKYTFDGTPEPAALMGHMRFDTL